MIQPGAVGSFAVVRERLVLKPDLVICEVPGSGFQEGYVQCRSRAVLISQEFPWNRTIASGNRFPDTTRKYSGNLGYCHLSQVRIASFKNRTLASSWKVLKAIFVFLLCTPGESLSWSHNNCSVGFVVRLSITWLPDNKFQMLIG